MQQGMLPAPIGAIFKTAPDNQQEPKTMHPKGVGVENQILIFNVFCSPTYPHLLTKIKILNTDNCEWPLMLYVETGHLLTKLQMLFPVKVLHHRIIHNDVR